MKRSPSARDIMKTILAAVDDFSQKDCDHQEFEMIYHDETETLEIRVFSPHHVDIFSCVVDYQESYSG